MQHKAIELFKLSRQVLDSRKSIYLCDKFVYFKLLNAQLITQIIQLLLFYFQYVFNLFLLKSAYQ